MSLKESKKILKLINENISLSKSNVFQLRKDFEKFYLKFSSNQKLSLEKLQIKNIDAFKILASNANDNKIILFFHGGGFTVGSTKDHMDLCGKLSACSNHAIISIDYSLTPENKFPAALEDCAISYLWLLKQGIKPADIMLGGISTGGTLVLSTLLFLKERGVELPAGAVCMSPAVDMLFEGDSIVTNKGKDWISTERLYNLRKIYLKGEDPKNPLLSPLYGDLRGLPPLLIQAGSNELLLDDIIKFHKKARDAEVEVDFQLWKDMFHCFQIFSSCIDEGMEAITNAGNYIKETFDKSNSFINQF